MKRQDFLKSILGASAFAAMPITKINVDNDSVLELIKNTELPNDGSMYGYAAPAIDKVRIGIIGIGNRGKTLIEMCQWLVENNQAEIAAVSDIDKSKVEKARDKINSWQSKAPEIFHGGKDEWQKLSKRPDIDLIIITTPWEWHTPMAIHGMENGKHVASEVPIAYTLEDCWKLISVSEKTRKHCIMIENCCYNEEELFVLNMVQEGVFGDISHTEGAYLHDLRAHMLSTDYYKNQWRLKHHVHRNGNFYTTHGLGPISFYLDIGRGDNYKFLTSMSSRELNLSESAKRVGSPYSSFACGDMNTTMIKTEEGKTIMLQFDVHTGRPYSRINKVVGTKATHDGYPSRLYIDDETLAYGGHKWLPKQEYDTYKEKYKHPIVRKLKSISESFKQGHGGMDFVMMYRLIRALNTGAPLDINLYDSVMWSAVTPISELSVASNSISIPFPDFTAGKWKNKNKLEIMNDI